MTGVDAIATKEAKNCMICENYKKRELRESDPTPRKTVSRQAPNDNDHIPGPRQSFLPIQKFMS